MFGIIGLGAVGSLLAYFLNRAGYEPYVITRTWYGRYVIKLNNEEYVLKVKPVREFPNDVKYTFISVKAYDTNNVINYIKGIPIVFQNGIGGLEIIRERLGKGYAAIITYGLTRGHNTVELRGLGEIILSRELIDVIETLKIGGAMVKVVDDVEPYRWLKVLVNAAINPITAILRAPNGVLLENEYAHELALDVINEGLYIVNKLGITLPKDPVEETLEVASRTRDNLSSMMQDISQCRGTEIDFINGAIVRYGESLGIKTPVNKTLWLLVKSLERKCTV